MPINKKCIYCGRGESDGIKLSKSDIIPQALTNYRLIFDSVCEKEHNNKFSDNFESFVIDGLKFLSNKFDMFGKKNHRPKYAVEFRVDDYIIRDKKITNIEDLFNGQIYKGEKAGEPCLIGSLNELKKSSKYNPENSEEIDLSNRQIKRNIELDLSYFTASKTLRFAAKVAYEWYCKENSIFEYQEDKYSNIVQFIINDNVKNDNVNIITDLKLYHFLNDKYGIGSHTLMLLPSFDKNTYVLFSFFGLVIYKVKICTCLIDIQDLQISKSLAIRCDGVIYKDLKISFPSEFSISNFESIEDAILLLQQHISDSIYRIMKEELISLKNLKPTVNEISKIIDSEHEPARYNKLIGFNDNKRLLTLYVLYHLGKNNDKYCFNVGFAKNIIHIFNIDESHTQIYDSDTASDFKNSYRENTDNFIKTVESGIEVFNRAYEKRPFPPS